MNYPWDDQPDEGFYGPQQIIPPAPMMPGPSDFAMEQAPQEQSPNDFWARISQGTGGQGPFPQGIQLGNKPTGLEMLLSLLGGVATGKTRQASGRISEVEQRNARTRGAAKELADRRWELRRMKYQGEINARNAALSQAGKPTATPAQKNPIVGMWEGKRAYLDPVTMQPISTKATPPELAMSPFAAVDADGNPTFIDRRTGQELGGGFIPATRATIRKPNQAELDQTTMHLSMMGQIGAMKSAYRPSFVGPKDYPLNQFRLKTTGAPEGFADFDQLLNGIRNYILQMRSGAAVTPQEATRLEKEIAVGSINERNFVEKMNRFETTFREVAANRRKTMGATGVNVSELDAFPGASGWGSVASPAAGPAKPGAATAPASGGKDVEWVIDSNGNMVRK